MVEVKAGQWWVHGVSGHRVFVHGVSKRNSVLVEYKDGSAGGVDQPYFSRGHKHLPDCTGWDWVPEIYPQYRETVCRHDIAFLRLDSPARYSVVYLDGRVEHTCDDSTLYKMVANRAKLTEEEALARIVKPGVKYPIYWTTIAPSDYAYLEQVDADNVRTVQKDGTPNRPGKASHHEFMSRTRLTEEQAKALIVKPKPKPALRKIKVHTVTFGCDELKFVSMVLDSELNSVKRDWACFTVLKTEEFEVPCD